MDVINYLMGKGNKIDIESPHKRSKQLSSAQQIYLQQIQNYIQVGGGYDILKDRLFKDLNNNYMNDSPFVQEIIIKLRKGLEMFINDNQFRSIIIIQDLICNCSPIMNQAFNQKKFCQSLSHVCLNSQISSPEVKERACGIFLYWHIKLNNQPNYLYQQYYQRLRNEQAVFPMIPFIKQVKQKQKQPIKNDKSSLQSNITSQILKDCEDVITNAQNLYKNDRCKIDTNMVRLLKIKNKKLYEMSISNEIILSQSQKQKISLLYKKIRNFLKELEKSNLLNIKNNVLEKQKQFLQIKQTPKKKQKQIPKIPLQSNKKISNQKKQQQPKIISPVKQNLSYFHQQIIGNQNLIDLNIDQITPQPKNTNQLQKSPTSSPNKPTEIIPSPKKQAEIISSPHKSTEIISSPHKPPQNISSPNPTRNEVKVSQQLIDLSPSYSSPSSTKQLNFKQLYAQNQLSPQFKDIDLFGNSKNMKDKQKIKGEDSDQGQFGEFK